MKEEQTKPGFRKAKDLSLVRSRMSFLNTLKDQSGRPILDEQLGKFDVVYSCSVLHQYQ